MKTEYYFINNDTRFINIAGDDRQEFLQGLITNDINACNRNNPIYTCILSPQGKFLADFFVIELDGSYLIEIHNRFFDNILQKLQLYKLKSKVIISENNSYLSCVLFINKKITVPNHLISFQDPRNNNIGIRYTLNTDNSSSLKKLGFPMYVSGMARGLLSIEDLPIYRHSRKKSLRETDLVIMAGTPCDFRLDYGKHINHKAKIISINLSKQELYLNRKPYHGVLGDPGMFLIQLSQIDMETDWDAWHEILKDREQERNQEILKQTHLFFLITIAQE